MSYAIVGFGAVGQALARMQINDTDAGRRAIEG
jgi:predicted dinucleotide-binding enzyme